MSKNNVTKPEGRWWWLTWNGEIKKGKSKYHGYNNAKRNVGDNNNHVDSNGNVCPHAKDDIDNGHDGDGKPHCRDDGHVGSGNDDANRRDGHSRQTINHGDNYGELDGDDDGDVRNNNNDVG